MKTTTVSQEWLLLLYMRATWANKPAVVVCSPGLYMAKVMPMFPQKQYADLVNAEYGIIACDTVDQAITTCHGIPDSQPYALAWDGTAFVSGNS